MTEKEREFYISCDSFKNYASIDEYKADMLKWLKLSSWHYSEETAKELMESNSAYIEQAYADRVPVSDAAVDVGYCCG